MSVAGKDHARVVTADTHNLAAIGTNGGHGDGALNSNGGIESMRRECGGQKGGAPAKEQLKKLSEVFRAKLRRWRWQRRLRRNDRHVRLYSFPVYRREEEKDYL